MEKAIKDKGMITFSLFNQYLKRDRTGKNRETEFADSVPCSAEAF